MQARELDAIADDSRGILDPGRMRERVDFSRFGPPAELRGVVQWFWAVRWSMPAGEEFVQSVLPHPSANLSVGVASSRGIDDDRIEATAVGVPTAIDRRRLRGRSWNVAAKLEPGALGAFLAVDAATLTDRVVPMGDVLPCDTVRLVADLADADGDPREQARILGSALVDVLAGAPEPRVAAARETARLGAIIERDRSIRSVAALAAHTGYGVRALQRQFRQHAGVSPPWMIRRYRLIDAADAARTGRPPRWAELASELGYADQAHLTRDFTRTLGQTPARYAASVTPLDP